MKNTFLLLVFVMISYACSDLEQFEDSPKLQMGAEAKKTDILSIVTVGSKATVQYNLTVGAKYSVQVYPFASMDPLKTLPLTAEEEITTKIYDLSDLPDGLYDITLTDIAGVSIKKPLIIKR